MRAKQRLDGIEEALAPREGVLHWLSEARAYPTFTAYVASLLDEPKAAYPSVRLPLRVAGTVEDQLRGHSKEHVAQEARKAMFATAFLVILVGVIDAALEETLRSERLRAAGHTFWERALRLEAGRSEDDMEAGEWADWRRAAEVHRGAIDRVEAARRLAEERHYAARSCLFPALEADWTSTIRNAHRLGGVAGAALGAHDLDPEGLLGDWELQAWTELFRSLGLGTAAMSLADHQFRRSLEEDGTASSDRHHDQGDR